MNIQIWGRKKCFDTKKAERWFKERRIKYQMIDLDRSRIYIANTVKCRPPKNRDPRPEELASCMPCLREQLEVLDPKIIVCLGRISAQALIREDYRITREHGQWVEKGGIAFTAIYHPSALLRDVSKRPETFSDLLSIREKVRELCPEIYQ